MIKLHFGVKQLKISKNVGVLHSFVWNYVNTLTWRVFAETVTIIIIIAVKIVNGVCTIRMFYYA